MSEASNHPRAILLVEDNDDHAELILRAYETLGGGRDLVRVRDGVEALAHLKAASALPDLLLVDLRLPRMDGLELIATLGAQGVSRGLAVVVMSSSDADGDRDAALTSGALRYVVKPMDLEALAEALWQVDAAWRAWAARPST